ncbi:hypothetical protein ABGT15_06285 [Flavobacterium enshiense]|uniref:hypothetical protein n=1 Tax=Flavobacterium enshiense TaxID=1341165 RepID=UPI00345D4032
MGKYFLRTLLVLLILSLVYKAVFFLSSDKAEGEIIGYGSISSKYHGRKGKVSFEKINSPVIRVLFDNQVYEVSEKKWGFFNEYEIGEKLLVFTNKSRVRFEINSVLHYWITFYDLGYGFLICILSTVFFGIIKPPKDKVPVIWK